MPEWSSNLDDNKFFFPKSR